ncbi:MAG: PDZ domain-containing protein [Planctomycetaceae bacterium]|nr:PDZ domain-containing protein [Planctomycetaceae bacterium]HRX77601.1 Trx7/PDZ domain-containing (seleno)protein [Pirellulaceae bacterium]
MSSRITFLLMLLFSAGIAVDANSQTREEKVLEDRRRVEAEGFWIYNNLPLAFDTAKKNGKPILVVLRCIPCEECVKLDDELVEQDEVIRPLLDEFVCARVVSTNGLDLSLFQFDTDQSFAVFFLNADKTIYGRFGTRSHRTEWFGDVSLKGLAAAMQGALKLHANYPANATVLAAKRGPKPDVASPEQYPSLKDQYTDSLNYSGNVVKSCIHCHQIGDAQRDMYRSSGKPLPESLLFPYPHPKAIGLIIDPDQRAVVKEVQADTPAAKAGLQAGDMIQSMNGQPLLSIADIQWVLHQTPASGGQITTHVVREGAAKELTLELGAGWRQADEISWRVSSWGLRRMTTGGMLLAEATAEQRQAAGVAADEMALHVKHLGQYGAHAAAKKAGVQKDDILIGFDGRTDLVREADVFRQGMWEHKPGQIVPITVSRNGKQIQLELPMQE